MRFYRSALILTGLVLLGAGLAPAAEEDTGKQFRSAELLIKGKQYGAALGFLEQVLENEPAHLKALYYRAYCNEKTKKFEPAIKSYERCIEILLEREETKENRDLLKKCKKAILRLDEGRVVILRYANQLEREAKRFKGRNEYAYQSLMNMVAEMRGEAFADTGEARLPEGAILILTFEKSTLLNRGGQRHFKDLSGNKNHAKWLGGGQLVKGKAGDAVRFQRWDDCVDAGNLNWFGDQWTWSIWVKLEVDKEMSLVRHGDGDCPTLAVWHQRLEIEAGDRSVNDTTPFPVGSWQHLVAMRNGNILRLYRNGRIAGLRELKKWHRPTGTFVIGRKEFLADEVAIFKRALSDREVRALYNLGKKGKLLKKARK